MNLPVAFLGFVFWLMETRYFGWNALPQSPAEVLSDGLAILIFALAFQRKSTLEIRIIKP